MKKENEKQEAGAIEQIESAAEEIIGEQAECDTSASKIGKFNGTDELLSAYNALQSEFTKRCQLIKQLQAELDGMRAQADFDRQTDNVIGDDDAVAATEETANSAPVTVIDAEYAARLSDIPEVMDACIARYKQQLIESRLSPSPSGVAVIVPQKRPKPLSEAKRLADELLAKL